jgi:hypothetical protein
MAEPVAAPPPTPPERVWTWRTLAALLIVGAAVLRVVYLASFCTLDLSPDEAHYWDWSRNLDWSYYSKGPLVAYLIRAGCELAGPWSEQVTANRMLAVRLPAVVCGSLLLAALYVLAVQVFRREKLACVVVALGLTLPVLSAGSLLMTIDAPYSCCWAWALVFGHEAVWRRATWAWAATGVAVGLGILAKYNMGLWIPSLAVFLLTSREHRPLLGRPGFWVMTGLAGLGCLPILVWNARHDWVTLKHVGGLSRAGSAEFHWDGPLAYVGAQFAMLLGFWFVAWAAALVEHRPWREPDARLRYLWWQSAPMFAVFLAFSPKTGGGEPNWPVTAYVSGMLLAVAWVLRRLASPRAWVRRLTAWSLAASCGLGLAVSVLMHHSEWVYPVLGRVIGKPTIKHPVPLRRFDPTCRLRGFRTLAAKVDEVRDRLRQEGVEPVVAGSGWSMPGELGFYCAGHPTVYSVGPAVGDRRSQYDLWTNPFRDRDEFLGRTFIVVGAVGNAMEGAFERIDPPVLVTHYAAGVAVADWPVTVCHGFKGFPKELLPPGY